MNAQLIFNFITFCLIFLPNCYSKSDPILYCDICRAVIAETRFAITQMPKDQKVRITHGQGRLGSTGNLKTKSKLIPITQSQDWLEEQWEGGAICNIISQDYVKWFSGKDHKQWRVGKIMTFEGKMNTDIDLAYLQSGTGEAKEVVEKDPSDRTRTIRWYCENAIEQVEEELYKAFKQDKEGKINETPTRKVCHEIAGWCDKNFSHEEYKFKNTDKGKSKDDESSEPAVNDQKIEPTEQPTEQETEQPTEEPTEDSQKESTEDVQEVEMEEVLDDESTEETEPSSQKISDTSEYTSEDSEDSADSTDEDSDYYEDDDDYDDEDYDYSDDGDFDDDDFMPLNFKDLNIDLGRDEL